ncbi:alpha-L-arabinofuranosidase [Lentzea sp. PSKA42]|uniref:Alpha-L-arabinofuranosidase n=1 Tax=Lentzea indica TaxID=2604800 RepID=A0ABX1F9C0_9PSEU|nr:glycoside hydrolase family 43 protein [Lentzea indica]NKE55464.1 alpha-L-arabinofuranosidase [Lentzea indica]
MKRLIRLLTLAALVVGSAAVPTPAQAATDSAYVMGYFKESLNGSGNVNAVHLAVSDDGLEWTPLNDNNAILTPTAGTKGIRDPFVHRLNDGTWVVLATDIPVGGDFGKANPNIHVWTSPDLVTWSADRLLNVNGANPNSFSWAPAVHWDPSRNAYGITFSTVPQGFSHAVIAVVYTTDFVTTTAPVVFFDGGSAGVIDSHVITGVNGMNYLYYRNNATTSLAGARSTSLAPGSFTRYGPAVGDNRCTEAPTLVKSLTANKWWLWGDTYCPNAKFDLWEGDLAAATWTKVDRQSYTAPLNGKHNTVHPITAADRDRLLQRYGGTSWNRVKSLNFPGHYVRHASFAGRIDEQPFEPYQDSQWRLRAGLSDPGAVSFESVNQPGHYLRHQGFEVKLMRDDGTSGFARDATFTKVAGLADSAWSSFRSVNHPTRYLRHSNFVLRIDEITTATGRADATFHVGH